MRRELGDNKFESAEKKGSPQTLERYQLPALELLLSESAKIHGHLCPGQVLGVRMSLLGLEKIGIGDPKGSDKKNIIVFVEMDRCATDAIQSVTGCSLGHRTMKFADYGKMAATFVNLKTGRAMRVVAREESREKAKEYISGIENKYTAQLEAYKIMPDEDLFDTREVAVKLNPEDMPGRPLKRVKCDACGEYVQDSREVCRDGKFFCRPCADSAYYIPREENFLETALCKLPITRRGR
jgi:formylmethanofuran dehydrogenase subunit E